jgi:signal transduction histidine kinase
MRRSETIPRSLLFIVPTVMGVSSTAQAYRLHTLLGDECCDSSTLARLLVLNLVYWYVPALLAPTIIAGARRARSAIDRTTLTVLVHVGGAFAYSLIHTAAMLAFRAMLFPLGGNTSRSVAWWTYAQREYFTQLDWLLMTYFFLVGLAHAMTYRRESEKHALRVARLHSRLVEAQLQALQRQLHPHFLFNTLNTISGLMHQDVKAADEMIDRLSDLLRVTLETSGVQEVPLRQELSVLKTYLDIEQTRFRDRLTVRMEVDPEVLDAFVPNFVLQPLVENEIRHGIVPHPRPGRVTVSASRQSQQLYMEVRDTGYGLPPDRLQALNKGVGLANTRARLDHLYGPSHQFVFSNLEGGGFSVRVVIPYSVGPSIRSAAETVEEVA